jgi:crotonobetainyl-CoA:carnitine CoA-transferase CaiB-like acyl-CoA transferase
VPRSLLSQTLEGVRVLDLTRNLAGPFCTMLLGDLGADVVKIEQPGRGDDTRAWSPPDWGGHSAVYLASNRNKRSLAVDLDRVEGQGIVRTLAERADVVVESFRPGSLTKRGLDYASVAAVNDRVVYCSITAYGSRGPKRDLPGYDPVLQAESGIMDLTGRPDEPPVRLGIGAVDLGTALWATIGIQAALTARQATGRGTHVQASLFETSSWWLSYLLAGYLGSGDVPRRRGSAAPFVAPYEVFCTADRDLLLAVGNDGLFRTLVDLLGMPELAEDDAYRTNADRVANREALHDVLQARFTERTAAEWQEMLQSDGIPCSPVRTVADLAADPQLDALRLLASIPSPDVPELRLVDVPFSMDLERATHRYPPPRLGEHAVEVLGELGYSEADVSDLRRRGVVG